MQQHTHIVAWFVVGILLLAASPGLAQTAPPDTTKPGDLLKRLQRHDEAQFGSDIREFDTAFRDSMIGALDSLGLQDFKKQSRKRQWRLGLNFDLATQLWDYNRVEGLVAGGGLTFEPLGRDGPGLTALGAYATGAEKFRHYEGLAIPLVRDGYLTARGHYEDRVVPFGSNRPTGNSVRGLIGAEDAQDYLRARGGGAYLFSRPHRYVRLFAGYEAAKQNRVLPTTRYALFGGDLPRGNAPIDEGIDRAAVVGLRFGSLSTALWEFELRSRIAGGGLGGDFAYNRTDLDFATRRYLGRQEFVFNAGFIHTASDAPLQQRADVGGLDTVRGYQRRTLVGSDAVHARLEYLVPYDFFGNTNIPLLRRARLQFVPWGDAGRAWDAQSDEWISSVGLGMQYFLGPFGQASFLRLDFSLPIGPDRSDDVRFDLRFAAGFF